MATEYDLGDGMVLNHFRADDWYVTVDSGWWREHYLMCNDECAMEVDDGGDGVAPFKGSDYRGEIGLCNMLDELVNLGTADGPYREGNPYFAELTYNHENAFTGEMLIVAAHVDCSGDVWWKARRNPLVRALVTRHLANGGNLADLYDSYVVGIGDTSCYGEYSTRMDVYVDPNMDDDYDVARWEPDGYAWELDVEVDGPNGPSYRNRLKMYDVSAMEWCEGSDVGDDDASPHQTIDGWEAWPMGEDVPDAFMMCGSEGVWYVAKGEAGAWDVSRVGWMI